MNVAGSTRGTLIPDILGSIVASLDASSGTLTKSGFQTYGESSTTPTNSFGYIGARVDSETNGLYDFRARMYSPTLGRFLQPDPIGYASGINLYAYVANDPLNLVDVFGLASDNPQTPTQAPQTPLTQSGTDLFGTSTNLPQTFGQTPQPTQVAQNGPFTVKPQGFGIQQLPGPDPLDPQGLNTPISPTEMQQIANVLSMILNGNAAGLQPHNYQNLPSTHYR